jgi:hypothetical protein
MTPELGRMGVEPPLAGGFATAEVSKGGNSVVTEHLQTFRGSQSQV